MAGDNALGLLRLKKLTLLYEAEEAFMQNKPKVYCERQWAVHQPRKAFLITLITTIHLMCGKLTFTNLSRYIDLSEQTYSPSVQ